MKIGIDSYCFHRYFGEVYPNQEDPGRRMTYEDFLRRAIELGVDGVSLETCFFESTDESYLKKLKALIDQGNFEVVVAWGHPEGLEYGESKAAVEEMLGHFKTCEILGASVLRICGSRPGPPQEPHQPLMDRIAQVMKEQIKKAEDKGIKLAMENHYDFTCDEMLNIFEQVGSDYFGMTYDTGNALRIGDEPVKAVKKMAKYIFATHTKDIVPVYGADPQDWDFFSSVPVGDGIIDMPALVKTLIGEGYDGLFAIELDRLHPDYEDEDPALAKSVEYLKKLRETLSP